jgi:chromosome condensin MukBEF ATPase and DNA-binding subunit MukB
MEIKDVTRCAFMAPDPKLMTVNLGEVEAFGAQVRAQREKAAPPPGKADLHKEYNALRQQLFNLTQNAKAYEQRANDAAGKVRLLEQRINETLKLKADAASAGNLRGERTFENAIQRIESELADAQEEFDKNKRWSGQAARALRAFDGADRLIELKAILDGSGQPHKK